MLNYTHSTFRFLLCVCVCVCVFVNDGVGFWPRRLPPFSLHTYTPITLFVITLVVAMWAASADRLYERWGFSRHTCPKTGRPACASMICKHLIKFHICYRNLHETEHYLGGAGIVPGDRVLLDARYCAWRRIYNNNKKTNPFSLFPATRRMVGSARNRCGRK